MNDPMYVHRNPDGPGCVATPVPYACVEYFLAGGASTDPRDQGTYPGGHTWDRNDPDRPSAKQNN